MHRKIGKQQRAEEIGPDHHAQHAPGAENNQRQRNPSAPDDHALRPDRGQHGGSIGAGQTGHEPAEENGEEACAQDAETQIMCDMRIFSDHAQDQPAPGFPDKPDQPRTRDQCQVDDEVLLKEDGSQNRDVAKQGQVELAGRGKCVTFETAAQQCRQAQPQNADGKARCHLIG